MRESTKPNAHFRAEHHTIPTAMNSGIYHVKFSSSQHGRYGEGLAVFKDQSINAAIQDTSTLGHTHAMAQKF
jgi:hypothetical protein